MKLLVGPEGKWSSSCCQGGAGKESRRSREVGQQCGWREGLTVTHQQCGSSGVTDALMALAIG